MPAEAPEDSGTAAGRRTRIAVLPLIVLIRAYQLLLSPWFGTACRFQPSCSHYAVEALETWGVARGCALTLKRLARCRPGGGSGYDPVPERKERQEIPK